MENVEAYSELRRLVKKYITSINKKTELLEILMREENPPPVRGIVNDIYEATNEITAEDKDLIDDLMYFFG